MKILTSTDTNNIVKFFYLEQIMCLTQYVSLCYNLILDVEYNGETMKTKNKLIILICVLSIVIIAAITATVIVLVTPNQSTSTAINVTFTATDVDVTLQGNYIVGNTTTAMMTPSGATSLVLNPASPSGSIEPEQDITLPTGTYEVVFEYIFRNNSPDIAVKIDLIQTPVLTNMTSYYTYSTSRISNLATLNRSDSSSYTAQGLQSGTNSYVYIYIVATVNNKMVNASFDGTFHWDLDRTIVSNITFAYNSSNVATSALLEPGFFSNTNILASDNGISEPIAKANGYLFEGWYSQSTLEDQYRVSFPHVVTNGETIYAKFLTGNIPSANIKYDLVNDYYTVYGQLGSSFNSNTLVIPDYYNDGVNGVAPVVGMEYCYNEEYDWENYGIAYKTGLTHVYVGNNISTISASFANYSSMGAIQGSNTDLQYLFIGRGVKTIGSSALGNCSNLTSIQFPSTLQSVGNTEMYDENWYPITMSGFYNTGLYNSNAVTVQCYDDSNKYILINGVGYTTTANIPNWDNVVFVPAHAWCTAEAEFDGMYSYIHNTTLASATIPSAMTNLSDYLFYDCANLTSITIPSSVTSIGNYAFYGCSNLTSITIPSSVTSIGTSAFWNCSSLTSISIPSGVTSIGNSAFSSCSNLTTVTFNGTSQCTAIGNNAFAGCSRLVAVTIPASVITIGANAFQNCTALRSSTITFENTTGWKKGSNAAVTSSATAVNVSTPSQNATWLVSTSGYYNYYWKRF